MTYDPNLWKRFDPAMAVEAEKAWKSATPEQHKLMQRYMELFAPGTQREAARVTVHCIRRLGGTIKAREPRKLTPAEALQLTEEDFEAATA